MTLAGFFSCGEQRDPSMRQSYNLLYTLCLRMCPRTLMCNLTMQGHWKILEDYKEGGLEKRDGSLKAFTVHASHLK